MLRRVPARRSAAKDEPYSTSRFSPRCHHTRWGSVRVGVGAGDERRQAHRRQGREDRDGAVVLTLRRQRGEGRHRASFHRLLERGGGETVDDDEDRLAGHWREPRWAAAERPPFRGLARPESALSGFGTCVQLLLVTREDPQARMAVAPAAAHARPPRGAQARAECPAAGPGRAARSRPRRRRPALPCRRGCLRGRAHRARPEAADRREHGAYEAAGPRPLRESA